MLRVLQVKKSGGNVRMVQIMSGRQALPIVPMAQIVHFVQIGVFLLQTVWHRFILQLPSNGTQQRMAASLPMMSLRKRIGKSGGSVRRLKIMSGMLQYITVSKKSQVVLAAPVDSYPKPTR